MRTQTEQRCWREHRGLIVTASGSTPTALKPPIASTGQNEQLSAVLCKYVDGLIQTSEWNRPVLQSASVRGVSVLFRFGWESHLWHNLQLLLPQRLTAETREQSGGQDSPLSDDCFLLALIDQNKAPLQSPIPAKWITDTSDRTHCSTQLSY